MANGTLNTHFVFIGQTLYVYKDVGE